LVARVRATLDRRPWRDRGRVDEAVVRAPFGRGRLGRCGGWGVELARGLREQGVSECGD
jgi:hypothetical protein